MPFIKSDVYACPHCGYPLCTKEKFLSNVEESARMKYCGQCGKKIASDVAASLAKGKD